MTLRASCSLSVMCLQVLHAAQRRCEELEESLRSRSQVLEMLQQEVTSADQQKQVKILLNQMPFSKYMLHLLPDISSAHLV